jgi:hypothetical protein
MGIEPAAPHARAELRPGRPVRTRPGAISTGTSPLTSRESMDSRCSGVLEQYEAAEGQWPVARAVRRLRSDPARRATGSRRTCCSMWPSTARASGTHRIQTGVRLVAQDDLRVQHQRAGQASTLCANWAKLTRGECRLAGERVVDRACGHQADDPAQVRSAELCRDWAGVERGVHERDLYNDADDVGQDRLLLKRPKLYPFRELSHFRSSARRSGAFALTSAASVYMRTLTIRLGADTKFEAHLSDLVLRPQMLRHVDSPVDVTTSVRSQTAIPTNRQRQEHLSRSDVM